jgi:hypothetical protein
MADEQDGGQAPAPGRDDGGSQTPRDPLKLVPGASGAGGSESIVTVLVAFAANALIAVAKTARLEVHADGPGPDSGTRKAASGFPINRRSRSVHPTGSGPNRLRVRCTESVH